MCAVIIQHRHEPRSHIVPTSDVAVRLNLLAARQTARKECPPPAQTVVAVRRPRLAVSRRALLTPRLTAITEVDVLLILHQRGECLQAAPTVVAHRPRPLLTLLLAARSRGRRTAVCLTPGVQVGRPAHSQEVVAVPAHSLAALAVVAAEPGAVAGQGSS